eukprot:2406065-Rhodomonas_salina.11
MSHPQATETVEEAGDTEAELSRASSEFLRERFYSIAGPEDEHTEMQSAADQDKVSGDAAAAGNNLIRRTQSEVDGMNRDLSDLLRRRVPNQTDSVPLSTKEEMTDAICGLLYRILQSEQQLPNPAQGDTAVEDSCAVPDSGVQVAEEGDAVPKLTGLLDLLRLLCKYDEIPSSTQLSRIVDVADAICSLLSGSILALESRAWSAPCPGLIRMPCCCQAGFTRKEVSGCSGALRCAPARVGDVYTDIFCLM